MESIVGIISACFPPIFGQASRVMEGCCNACKSMQKRGSLKIEGKEKKCLCGTSLRKIVGYWRALT